MCIKIQKKLNMAQPEKGEETLIVQDEVGKTITLYTGARAVILTKKQTSDPRGFSRLGLCFTGTDPEFCPTCDERSECPLVKGGLRV